MTSSSVKVISWNVNSIGQRLGRLLALLERERPDFVCLQELKCVDDKFPVEAVKAAGYHPVFHGQKAYNGVAILCRTPPAEESRGFDDGGDDSQARFIAIRHDQLTVMSAYVPNGQSVGSDKYAYKLAWLERLWAYVERKHDCANEKLVLVGDFNIAPADLDVHDPVAWREQILCSTAEREKLTKICALGFSDTFRQLHPEERSFSWWDYRNLSFPKNTGLRIDLILASTKLAPTCTSARIDRDERKGEKASDHAPVVAEFML